MTSSIEWVAGDDGSEGKTWNPTRGCRRVSPECERCYAEADAHRRNGMQRALGREEPYGGLLHISAKGDVRWNGRGRFVPYKLIEPLSWKKPTRVFVDSMSDLFFEAFTFEEIAAVWGVMASCSRHTFIVLTKRPGRALEFFEWLERQSVDPTSVTARCAYEAINDSGEMSPLRERQLLSRDELGRLWPLPHVIVGVSVGTRAGLHRIDRLREMPAALRAVSFEPLLEDLGEPDLRNVDWAIIGGESGRDPRSTDLDWVRGILRASKLHGAKPFVKALSRDRGSPLQLLEDIHAVAVRSKYGLPLRLSPEVALCDLRMLATEGPQVLPWPPPRSWELPESAAPYDPRDGHSGPKVPLYMAPDVAERAWLAACRAFAPAGSVAAIEAAEAIAWLEASQ